MIRWLCGFASFTVVACSNMAPPAMVCAASTCAGCCDATGTCQSGSANQACGRLGLSCVSCQASQTCVSGLCQSVGGGRVGGGSGGGTSGAGGGVNTGGTGGGRPPVEKPTRFASIAQRFNVPGLDGGTYNALRSRSTGGGSPYRYWETGDLNGDDLPDLMITATPTSGSVFAPSTTPHWRVHYGNANGFSAQPAMWAVPGNAALPDGYNLFANFAGSRIWYTQDITGDGRADLVHTANPTMGGPYFTGGMVNDGWLVRRNTNAGFDDQPLEFSVPRVGRATRFDRLTSESVNSRWLVTDITGDGQPDLVVTTDPETDQVWLSGGSVPQWLVCPGRSTGFAPVTSCLRLDVPGNGTSLGFRSANLNVPVNRTVWLLIDLNGDRKPDLIQTMNPSDGAAFLNSNTGAPYWRVWFNQYAAGATALFPRVASEWSVPAPRFNVPSNVTALQIWGLLDFTGDGAPELIETTDSMTGKPFATPNGFAWRVYENGKSGFRTTGALWPIPGEFYLSLSGSSWVTQDFNGDHLPDLVGFRDPATGQAFVDSNGPHWRVFPAVQ